MRWAGEEHGAKASPSNAHSNEVLASLAEKASTA
jgi:hypothetical protein